MIKMKEAALSECCLRFMSAIGYYMQPAKAEPDYVIKFAARYGLSQRETDLLHKTGCSKRTDILALFDSFRNFT